LGAGRSTAPPLGLGKQEPRLQAAQGIVRCPRWRRRFGNITVDGV